jgi:hypothetical protein
MYRKVPYNLYMVEVGDKWVPALNVSFGMYISDTFKTGTIPNFQSKYRQNRVFITLPHGEFKRLRAFHFMLTPGKELRAGVSIRWDSGSTALNEHEVEFGSWGVFFGGEDETRKCFVDVFLCLVS